MKSQINIKVIDIDEGDNTICFQGFFRNERYATTLEFYGYSRTFTSRIKI